jgi:ADP-glucose pyrophosphorylase
VKISNAIIQSNCILNEGCAISKGSILTQDVVVKAGVTIPEGSICSLLTFDSQEEEFILATEVNEDYFEKGVIAYVPRDLVLK